MYFYLNKMVKSIVIGDPHFQVSNIQEVDKFIVKINDLAIKTNPDLIVILGDVLHNHERLHTIALNKAYEFFNLMKNIAPTFILVGNHDLCTNQEFLSKNHWMNAVKMWENIHVVDDVMINKIGSEILTFVPYVPNGRFMEALESKKCNDWKKSSVIFAHQEFKGCKMGCIISESGDVWDENFPPIISGHIHSNQTPQKNIYYPGSAMQIAFGESQKNIIAIVNIENSSYSLEEVDLELSRKKIVYIDVLGLEDYKIKENPNNDKIKITLSGEYENFKTVKKSEKYKKLLKNGIKIVFKESKKNIKSKNDLINQYSSTDVSSSDFFNILKDLVKKEDDEIINNYLKQMVIM
jgi:DNA repair exonuclease SbcCD nuclease subunit